MQFKEPGRLTAAHRSVDSKFLMEMGISKPDFMPTIMRLFSEDAPLISVLDIKKQKTRDLSYATNDANYKVVGSNHVRYPVALDKSRMDEWTVGPAGKTFVCDRFPNKPFFNNSQVIAWATGNWAGYGEVVELADGSQGHVVKDPELDTNDTFKYYLRPIGFQADEYLDPKVFESGTEFKAVYNLHPHDWSTRGTEKYAFDSWNDAYLSLQRFKYSRSGTAAAITSQDGKWVEHNGAKRFISTQEINMMRTAAAYLNYQLVFGKSTVSEDKYKVNLKDDQGNDILAGNGVLNSNGGPIKVPMNRGWNEAFIKAFMETADSYITSDDNGVKELVIMMNSKGKRNFSENMRKMGVTQNNNIENTGKEKGINDTYAYYEMDGIRLVPKVWNALEPRNRPGFKLSDGTKSSEWDAIAVPTGKIGGQPGVELVQLRPSVKGTVAGIDQGGNIASSIDGTSTHALFQNGIISRVNAFEIKRTQFE